MTTILETLPGRGCSLGVPIGIHPVTDVRDLSGSWVSDITVEWAAAKDECKRDAQRDYDAEGPHCLCGIPHPFEQGVDMDCPKHFGSKTKCGPNGLPLYKIRVLDGHHAVEVEGEPIPNDFGLGLFSHAVLGQPHLFTITEERTGAGLVNVIYEDGIAAIASNLEFIRRHRREVVQKVADILKTYGPLEECTVITPDEAVALFHDQAFAKVQEVRPCRIVSK